MEAQRKREKNTFRKKRCRPRFSDRLEEPSEGHKLEIRKRVRSCGRGEDTEKKKNHQPMRKGGWEPNRKKWGGRIGNQSLEGPSKKRLNAEALDKIGEEMKGRINKGRPMKEKGYQKKVLTETQHRAGGG